MQKRNRVGFQFFVTRFFRKHELDTTNMHDNNLLGNVKEYRFL
jgi:hypothetical protein